MTILKNIVALILIVVTFRCGEIDTRPQQTEPGCWYEGKRYQEGQVVETSEPCLRCRCSEGSPRCRLRVCTRLPSPLPSGCVTGTPRDNACCAELVCGDSHEKNVAPRRDRTNDTRLQDDGCLHEGVTYAPGSAMMGSRRCEYCYCISGSRRCLRPRCLLPLAGCTPLYAPHSCCPVAYNCTNSAHQTNPSVSSPSSSGNGCRVENRSYAEGEMVRDISWKATCDNCFCAMGDVRCVPLACAPPLQGCTPIVREGHCCPSTYNCSGTIEVKATQNYASYAFISKDYAKFRKETNFFPMDRDEEEAYESAEKSTVEGRGHKNSARGPTSTSAASTNVSMSPTATNSTDSTKNCIDPVSTKLEVTATIPKSTTPRTIVSSHETETMNNEIPTETMDYAKLSTPQQETTFGIGWTTIEPTVIPLSSESNPNIDDYSTAATTLNSRESTDSTNSIVPLEDFRETPFTSSEKSTVGLEDETTTNYNTIRDLATIEEETGTILLPEVKNAERNESKDKEVKNEVVDDRTKFLPNNSMEESAQKVKEFSQTFDVGEETVISVKGPVTDSPATILMPDDILVMNVTLKTNVSVGHVQGFTMNPVRSIAPDIEAILNITHRKKGEDYEYDYGEPTLPPSLPNVRIIPFVAADALVKADKEMPSPVTNYPLGSVGVPPQGSGPTVTGTMDNFYDIVTQENRFSPPVETEGGFVPREPPYFDPPYHSTDLNLEVRTGVTVLPADMTNPHGKNTELATNCMFENREYRHGELMPSSGRCVICICYYGEFACSDAKCPPLKIGCRRIENEKVCCGKIVCVDAEESPTVVLDRADDISASPRQPMPSIDGIPTPDPFRDVIKTEPAPDLPSLIEDMIPYLAEHRITTPSITTTPITTSTLEESNPQGHFKHRPDQDFPVKSNIDNIYLVNEHEPDKSSILNNTSKLINRTVEPKNRQSSSTGMSMVEDRPEVATTETSASPTTIKIESTSLERGPMNDDSSTFLFGNVFDLLFAKNTDAAPATTAESMNLEGLTKKLGKEEIEYVPAAVVQMEKSETESSTGTGAITEASGSSTIRHKDEEATHKTPTTTSSSDNEIATSVNSLLKLAGCNIYGRMYRVGRIITELSSPCLECRCTEIGVQCKQLEC